MKNLPICPFNQRRLHYQLHFILSAEKYDILFSSNKLIFFFLSEQVSTRFLMWTKHKPVKDKSLISGVAQLNLFNELVSQACLQWHTPPTQLNSWNDQLLKKE